MVILDLEFKSYFCITFFREERKGNIYSTWFYNLYNKVDHAFKKKARIKTSIELHFGRERKCCENCGIPFGVRPSRIKENRTHSGYLLDDLLVYHHAKIMDL